MVTIYIMRFSEGGRVRRTRASFLYTILIGQILSQVRQITALGYKPDDSLPCVLVRVVGYGIYDVPDAQRHSRSDRVQLLLIYSAYY